MEMMVLSIIAVVLMGLTLIYMIYSRKRQYEEIIQLKEEVSKMLVEGLTVNNEMTAEDNKRRFSEMEKSIVLNTRNNLLQGITELNRELSVNNEKILLQFTNFGQSLGNTINENNQLISMNINKFKDEFKKI